MKIAVSGKGGTGKTTISANLARLFSKNGRRVYAVDADPDSSLGLALGLDQAALDAVRPLMEMEDLVKDKMGDGAIFSLNPKVDEVAPAFCIKLGNINFLRMGDIKKGGSSCYCRENTFLRAVVDSLVLDSDDVVILDMGAGIEHLTRGTSKGVDMMLIITGPGVSSVNTARIVQKLTFELGIRKTCFIANKIGTPAEESFISERFKQDELLGIVHYDDAIAERAMTEGRKVDGVENPELEAVLSKIAGMKIK